MKFVTCERGGGQMLLKLYSLRKVSNDDIPVRYVSFVLTAIDAFTNLPISDWRLASGILLELGEEEHLL